MAPLHLRHAEPPPDDRSHPPTDDRSQPPPDDRSQPTPHGPSQPPADSRPQPLITGRPQPPPDGRPQPTTHGPSQPPADSRPQPLAIARPQPPATGRPQPPPDGRPQPTPHGPSQPPADAPTTDQPPTTDPTTAHPPGAHPPTTHPTNPTIGSSTNPHHHAPSPTHASSPSLSLSPSHTHAHAHAPALSPPPDAHTAALAEALIAAERGYPVIPLTRAKLPALRSPHRGHAEAPPCHGECGRLGHGVHDASTDPFTIRRMFAAAPWATGYGIACGLPPHHLIGLDLDTKNGADGLTALLFLAEAHDFPIPPTIMVRTPSGGRHLWLSGPPSPPVPNSVGRLAPGIDVRGAGGYLVGPGSLTTHGRYVLAPNAPDRPAPVPGALLTLLTEPPAHARHHPAPHPAGAGYEPPPDVPPQPAAALVRFVRSSPVGQRNARLFWAACRAYEDGLGPELTARLTEAACHTGLPEHEARATIASASRQH